MSQQTRTAASGGLQADLLGRIGGLGLECSGCYLAHESCHLATGKDTVSGFTGRVRSMLINWLKCITRRVDAREAEVSWKRDAPDANARMCRR